MVEYLLGKREIIAFGKEKSGYGTESARTYRFGLNPEVIPNDENDWQDVKGSGTDSITSSYAIGNKISKFTLRYVPQDWKFLYYVYGKTTNTGSGPYTHTFSTKTDKTSLSSFTLERARSATTDWVTKWVGCQVNTFKISWDTQGGSGGKGTFVSCESDVFAKSASTDTLTSLTAPTSAPFLATSVRLTLNSTAKAAVVSGHIVIDEKLTDGFYANTDDQEKSESIRQEMLFNGEFILHYTDSTEWDFMANRVVVPGTNTLVFYKSANDKLTFTFTNLRIVTAGEPTNLDGTNQITLRWIADNVSAEVIDSENWGSDYES